MSVGLETNKNQIDTQAGAISLRFQQNFEDVVTMQNYLLATSEADLIALGYTSGEVATLKTAFADLMQLGDIWRGVAALPEAKDFRVFVSRLWGIGAF